MKLNTARFPNIETRRPVLSALALAAAFAVIAVSATPGEARHHKAGARGSVDTATATTISGEQRRPQYRGGPKSPMYP